MAVNIISIIFMIIVIIVNLIGALTSNMIIYWSSFFVLLIAPLLIVDTYDEINKDINAIVLILIILGYIEIVIFFNKSVKDVFDIFNSPSFNTEHYNQEQEIIRQRKLIWDKEESSTESSEESSANE